LGYRAVNLYFDNCKNISTQQHIIVSIFTALPGQSDPWAPILE